MATRRVCYLVTEMPTPSRETLVLGNSTRLLNDARLLADHRRFASAFALAVLAVEEIGKALIAAWGADTPLAKPKGSQTLHMQKQTAVSSLLLATLAVRTFPEGAILEDLEGDKLTSLTRIFNESDVGRLFHLIQDGRLDKRKQNALYQDDLLTAVEDDFAEVHTYAVFKIAIDALDAMADKFTRRVGRAFYETLVLDRTP
jgi:AbiV family abortive infection protein